MQAPVLQFGRTVRLGDQLDWGQGAPTPGQPLPLPVAPFRGCAVARSQGPGDSDSARAAGVSSWASPTECPFRPRGQLPENPQATCNGQLGWNTGRSQCPTPSPGVREHTRRASIAPPRDGRGKEQHRSGFQKLEQHTPRRSVLLEERPLTTLHAEQLETITLCSQIQT